MNKEELIRKIAKDSGVTHAIAQRMLTSFTEALETSLTNGEKLSVRGLGTFLVRQRSARTARDPRTHETIQVPARRTVRFIPSSEIKSQLN